MTDKRIAWYCWYCKCGAYCRGTFSGYDLGPLRAEWDAIHGSGRAGCGPADAKTAARARAKAERRSAREVRDRG